MKRRFLIYIIFYAILISSCSNNDEPMIMPIFTTTELSAPPYSYIFLDAEIDEEQEDKIIESIEDHGFVWSTVRNNTLDQAASQIVSLGIKKRNYAFGAFVHDLKGNTTYFVRAYIKMNNQVYYANEISFHTNPGNWKKLKDFPGTNTLHAAAFVLNDKAYMVCKDEVWAFDPATETWDQKNNFPTQTKGATGFVINGVGYIYCGNIWRYDPSSDNWTSLIPGPQFLYLHKGCEGVSSFVYNGKAYIAGGAGNLNEGFLVYDPVTNEQYNLDFSHPAPNVYFASLLAEKGNAYMVGGKDFVSIESQIFSYDLLNKKWSRKKEFRNDRGFETARAEMVSFNINGDLYTGMGYGEFPLMYGTQVGSQDDFYRYNTTTDFWEPQTYPVFIDKEERINFLDRAGGIGFSIGNKGYMGLGELRKYNYETNQYEVTPRVDFWEFTPN